MIKRLIISLIFVVSLTDLCQGLEPLSLDESKPITEGEFAAMLIQAIGYEQELPAQAQAGDYIILLERYGIAPVGPWQADLPLTYGRLATILSRAMNLEHKPINDTDKCFRNVCEINKDWYMKYKETNAWPQLDNLEKPICPFGLAYEDTTGNHLVTRHSHPDVAEVENSYFEALSGRDMMLGERSPSDLVARAEARRIIEGSLSALLLAKGYLTPPTPILPKEAVQLKSAGRLVFIVYEDGLVDDRKVEWPVLWSKDKIVSVAIVYSHDAALNNNKSIKMYIDGIEVDACQGTWTRLTPDEHIWIGSQSQSGLFPSGIYIYDLKIYDLIKTDFVSRDLSSAPDKSILFWSLLDSKDQILSPKKGSPGDISKKIYTGTDISKAFSLGEGFLSNFDGEYILFSTTGNMNLLKGTIEFQAKPTFTSSPIERVLINNVKWDAKNGASGFYLYYQPEEKS